MQAEVQSSQASSSSAQLKRDTPCRYYYRSGSCKRGEKCLFSHEKTSKPRAHSPNPSRGAPLSAKATEFTPSSTPSIRLSASAEPFQPHLQRNGDDDEWQDEVPELRAPAAAPSPAKTSKSIMKGVPASVSKSNEPCSICMEVPTVYAQQPSCDHSFCPPCLDKWRRQRGLAKTKNCPICRAPSKHTFVTPQPFTSGARLLALQRFRERAAATPCQNLAKSLGRSNKHTKPFCVFGDDCLYQHEINGKPYKFGFGRYMINRNKKGTRRLVRPVSRSERSIGAEFFERIQDMDERVRMFLSTRVLLNVRSNVGAGSNITYI